MAVRVRIEVPGNGAAEAVQVDEGEAVLVGREPDAARAPALPRAPDRTVTLPSPSVSASHLFIRHDAGVTTLLDTGSRNGSWLKLPPGDAVQVRSPQPLAVALASPSEAAEPPTAPEDARWQRAGEFHEAVAAAVRAWFERLQMAVRVTTARRRDADAPASHLPLADGFVLQVVPLRTVNARWENLMTALWRYTEAQNATWAAEEQTRAEGLVLVSAAIRQAHRQVIEAARRGQRLLLVGPSGSGKDGLARCYHRHARPAGPFVAKNCSMFNREMLRAELFGAEQGAFTTALRRILGAVEIAHGGTLFLDEIGEMASDVQPLLLTFLDHGEYERMGAYGQPRKADVLLVSATNKDLRAATRNGEFREDLWYRIAGQVVHVPPLRERPEDLDAYLRQQRLGNELDVYTALSPAARERVHAHPWNGNFRELAGFVARLPRTAEAGGIGERACVEALRQGALSPRPVETPATPASAPPLDELSRAAGRAFAAFAEDHGHGLRRWEDVKECLERYLKPLLFAQLTAVDALGRREDASLSALAEAIDADRGTAMKQLTRFFERFKT